MARLVGATCPNCGAAVRLDPAREWVTCAYCKTSAFIETPARRHAANHPPPHIPVIKIAAAARNLLAIILLATILPVVIGVVVTVVSVARSVPATFRSSPTRSPDLPAQGGGSQPSPGAAQQVATDFFADPTPIPKLFQGAIGTPLRATKLSIFPGYAIINAQDPKKPGNVDRYTLRNGSVGAPDPDRLAGGEKDNLEAHLVDIAAIEFALLPKMIADARTRLGYEGGKVSHIMLTKGLPFDKNTLWRIYVSSDRESGRVEYDTAGRMKKVYK
jgi:hypothetical protein